MNIDWLPNEILFRVFDHFDTKTLARSSQVCKRWKLVSQDQTLWKKFSKEELTEKLNYKALCIRKSKLLNKIRHLEYKKYGQVIDFTRYNLDYSHPDTLILGKRFFFMRGGKFYYLKEKNSTLQVYKLESSIHDCYFKKLSGNTVLITENIIENNESNFFAWDINKRSCLFSGKKTFFSLTQIIKDSLFYENSKNLICYNMRTKKVMFTLPGLPNYVIHQASNNNYVAAACADQTIHVYDLEKKKKIFSLDKVSVYALSLTECKLIYQTRSKIYIYDLKTITLIHKFQILPSKFKMSKGQFKRDKHGTQINIKYRFPPGESRSIRHNQKIIIHVSKNHSKELRIRDLKQGRIIQKLRGPVDSITNFRLANNRVVAISTENKVVWIWDINSGQLKKTFNVSHERSVKKFQIENNILHLSIVNSNKSYSQFWDLTNCCFLSEMKFKENERRIVKCHYEDGTLTYFYEKCDSSMPFRPFRPKRYVVEMFKFA